ncbi:MAG: DUF805 domain-containing protein [Candidatus Taylorbacteria bacterium]|nr:DUF805 domain-containing protein [Candidatus Taylorbacteria bacterium]
MHVPQKGIVSFIKMKISSGVSPEETKRTLMRAGFAEEHVDLAFRFVKDTYPEILQEIVAANDFLPEIHKPGVKVVSLETKKLVASPKKDLKKDISEHIQKSAGVVKRTAAEHLDRHFKIHKGLFQGRLRRKDFTLGFLFFFAVGYVTLALAAVLISLISPELWSMVLSLIESDKNGALLLTIPVILAPITVMMLSLITRRLHNLELPGTLSWLFLVLFIPIDISMFYGMWFVYIALGILFMLLLAKKGAPGDNQYGPLPDSKGSFFKRIFNV